MPGTASPSSAARAPGPESLMRMLEHLVLTRAFETRCQTMWKAGEHMVGEYHLSIGQEAIAVGTCAALAPDDLVCPSIRGMGVYLARGTPLDSLMTTFFDRRGGIGDGRWAHWHSPVPECGILAQTGMLGSGLVTAVGVALAQKLRRTGRVVVAMLGDGATSTGYFHEGMNFAAFRDLPVVVVIENNQYAVSTPIRSVVKAERLSSRAAGYGIPGVTVDGNDVVAVHDAVATAVERARTGRGPSLIEAVSYRWTGSTVKDPDTLRPEAEKAEARRNCPVERLRRRLVAEGTITEADCAAMAERVEARIDAAYAAARQRPSHEPPGDFAAAYPASTDGSPAGRPTGL